MSGSKSAPDTCTVSCWQEECWLKENGALGGVPTCLDLQGSDGWSEAKSTADGPTAEANLQEACAQKNESVIVFDLLGSA